MHEQTTIAVLITCFNRREKTLTCLKSLYAQNGTGHIKLLVYLTDDGSTDGTSEAVKEQFPQVQVLQGTGNLFWAGGMRYTWTKALESKADFYLLINDDTLLYPDAITSLLQCSGNASKPTIVTGSTMDADTGNTSYGGSRLTSKLRWKSAKLTAADKRMPCDFANANILLVPAAVVDAIGILSDTYTHGLADYDYTLTAKKAGFDLAVAPGFLGVCKDDHGKNWRSSKVPLKERIKYLKDPKGLAYSEYLHFIKRHFPLSYPEEFCKLWMKIFFPFIWDTFKK